MKIWNFNQPVMVYHPNIQEQELADMDVDLFVNECVKTGAQAVVISAGGIYAFYHSKVADHHQSRIVEKRDLLLEIIRELHRAGLYVIARLDFSKVRMAVGEKHPDWLHADREGRPIASGDKYLATCPLSPYQNEAFARPVIEELLRDYGVDGFHLNAEGFHGHCFCVNCRKASGLDLTGLTYGDRESWAAFEHWRGQAFADQMERYARWMHVLKPDCFFMAELAGLEYLDWMMDKAFRFSLLSGSFSHILVASGGIKGARSSRYWAAMSADLAACAGRALINLKIQMRDMKFGKALLPLNEIRMLAYQAYARGAGLKITHFDLPHHVPDRRWRGTLQEIFRFTAVQADVMGHYRVFAPVMLVWPETWLIGRSKAAADKLAESFSGLYTALSQRHISFTVSLDVENLFTAGDKPAAVIVPVLDGISEHFAQAMNAYVEAGGLLVLIDFPNPEPESLSHKANPAMEELLGGSLPDAFRKFTYMLPDESLADDISLCGPLPMPYPCRDLSPLCGEARAWSAYAEEEGSPEDFRPFEKGTEKLLIRHKVGRGQVAVCAIPLGSLIHEIGLGDYNILLERILAEAGILPLNTDAADTVMLTLGETETGLILSLLQTGGTAPMNEVAVSMPIHCTLPCVHAAAVTCCEPGLEPQPLTFSIRKDMISFTVPCLRLFAQVVIRTQETPVSNSPMSEKCE